MPHAMSSGSPMCPSGCSASDLNELPRSVTAIDHKLGASYKFRFIAREIDDAPRDVIGLTNVSERVQRVERLPSLYRRASAFGKVRDHGSPDESGMDGIHANILFRIENSIVLRHFAHSTF